MTMYDVATAQNETERIQKEERIARDKCVMIINADLPVGIIANTAGIMGMTLGKYVPEIIGAPVVDQTGNAHLGIVEMPIPVLKADGERLNQIREQLYSSNQEALIVVDFSDVAQGCNAYSDYIKKAADTPACRFNYLGLALCGPKKRINQLTGNLPLLR